METHKRVVETALVHTLLGVAHDLYLIDLAETVEIADVLPAVVARQAGEYLVGGDTRALAFGGIDTHLPLREIEVERSKRHTDFGAPVECTDKLLCIVVELVHIAAYLVFKVDIQCVPGAITRNLCRCHSEDGGILDVSSEGIDFAYYGTDGLLLPGAFVPRLEFHNDVTRRTRLTGD